MFLTTVLGLALVAQGKLPGSASTLDKAADESQVIVIAEFVPGLIKSTGATSVMSEARLKPSETLKGKVRDKEMVGVRMVASRPELHPRKGEPYIFLVRDGYDGSLDVVKVLMKTEENLNAVKDAVKATKK